jgi:serine/threonine protein kinase
MLVMEYANSGTLREYLNNNFDILTWNNKFKMAYQLAYAVSYLHDKNVIHRTLVIHSYLRDLKVGTDRLAIG